MKFHVGKRLFVAAAVLGVLAVFATGFFVALGVRSVVAGPDSAPAAVAPNPGHEWSEIGLPPGVWSGLDADTVDGQDASELALLPRGVIVMWSGSIENIPEGWALADGETYTAPNGDLVTTPDLRDRFIVGAGSFYSVDDTGGSPSHDHGGETGGHVLTIPEMPRHQHKYWRRIEVNDAHSGPMLRISEGVVETNTDFTGGDQPHSHSISSSDHRPPYYALAYIMKL